MALLQTAILALSAEPDVNPTAVSRMIEIVGGLNAPAALTASICRDDEYLEIAWPGLGVHCFVRMVDMFMLVDAPPAVWHHPHWLTEAATSTAYVAKRLNRILNLGQ